MKDKLGYAVLGVVVGLIGGWVAHRPSSGEASAGGDGRSVGRSVSGAGTRGGMGPVRFQQPPGIRTHRWLPENEDHFLDPQTPAQHAEVQRLMRGAIEKEWQFATRMKAICDLLALMTPENLDDFREAYANSRGEGLCGETEWSVFVARYGELKGRQAAEEYMGKKGFDQVVVHWALANPHEAVAWANELEGGAVRDRAINRIIAGAGMEDRGYALTVFESLHPDDQPRQTQALLEAHTRTGGRAACVELAENLLGREEDALRTAGVAALRKAFGLFRDPVELDAWLETLPAARLALLDSAKLPERFRARSAAP